MTDDSNMVGNSIRMYIKFLRGSAFKVHMSKYNNKGNDHVFIHVYSVQSLYWVYLIVQYGISRK